MIPEERLELARMLQVLQQVAVDNGSFHILRPWFNQIVNRFDLPSTVYDPPPSNDGSVK